MGFTLQLAQDLVEVEAGGNSPVTVVVSNRGDATDRFELEVDGLDLEWKAIPVPVFSVEAGEVHSERAFFKPPRASESAAGNYPFVVRVRSLESGESKTVQGVLRVKPFHYLTLEISPKKGLYSWSARRNDFQVSIANLGNTEHTFQLVGSDPEDACTYEFAQERVTIGPGLQEEIPVEIRPVSNPVLAGSKLIGFSIHARSVTVPSVVASGQAQLERRSLLSPANLTVVVFLVLLFSAWWVMKPKPPTVDLQISPMEGLPGDKVTITWNATGADHVKITAIDADNKTTVLSEAIEGSTVVQMGPAGNETFFAEVSKGSNRGEGRSRTIKIDPPPALVVPKITAFSPDKAVVKVKVPGEVVFSWQVEGAVGVALTPDFPNLEPGIPSQSVTFNSATDKVYQLYAWSKDKQNAFSRKVRVIAYEESDAQIASFTATPPSVQSGDSVTISWNVVNAPQISMKHDGQVDSNLGATDSKTFLLTKDTSFVLEALDAKQRKVTKKVTVKVQAAPPPTTANPGPNDGTTGGTTSTTVPPTTSTTPTPTVPPTTGATGGPGPNGFR